MVKKIVLTFTTWKVLTFIVVSLIDPYIPTSFIFSPTKYMFSPIQNNPLIWMFANFDGAEYAQIARYGYVYPRLGYFPFYPFLIHELGQVVKFFFHVALYIIDAEIISNLALLGSFFVIYKLLKLDKQQNIFMFLILVILTFPTSYYLGAAYNDSLFLFFASLCLLVGRQKNWFLASIIGALATLTRLNGLALLFFILIEYFEISEKKLSLEIIKKSIIQRISFHQLWKSKIIFILLIPLAFIAYLVYIQLHFGTFMALFTSMKSWGQDRMVFPLQVFWRYFKIIFLFPTFKFNYWIAVAEFTSVIVYILLIIYSFKKIRFSYWIFMIISLFIPALTGTFQGMPRYALHLFPLFLAITLFLKDKKNFIKTIYFLICIILFLIFVTAYTNGYFVA